MKRSVIAILAACTLLAAAPLYAGSAGMHKEGAAGSQMVGSPSSQTEGAPGSQMEGAPGSQQMTSKDECLLYSKNCMTSVDSLQTKMKKLNNEIQKGTRVYSPQELKRLEMKLKEANDELDSLLHH